MRRGTFLTRAFRAISSPILLRPASILPTITLANRMELNEKQVRLDFCRLSADDFTIRTKGIMIEFKRQVWLSLIGYQ